MWDLLNDVGYWDRWGMSLTKHILPVVPLVWWELVGETPTSHQNKLVELILIGPLILLLKKTETQVDRCRKHSAKVP